MEPGPISACVNFRPFVPPAPPSGQLHQNNILFQLVFQIPSGSEQNKKKLFRTVPQWPGVLMYYAHRSYLWWLISIVDLNKAIRAVYGFDFTVICLYHNWQRCWLKKVQSWHANLDLRSCTSYSLLICSRWRCRRKMDDYCVCQYEQGHCIEDAGMEFYSNVFCQMHFQRSLCRRSSWLHKLEDIEQQEVSERQNQLNQICKSYNQVNWSSQIRTWCWDYVALGCLSWLENLFSDEWPLASFSLSLWKQKGLDMCRPSNTACTLPPCLLAIVALLPVPWSQLGNTCLRRLSWLRENQLLIISHWSLSLKGNDMSKDLTAQLLYVGHSWMGVQCNVAGFKAAW